MFVSGHGIIFYFSNKLFNFLRLVQSCIETSFSNTMWFGFPSAKGDLNFLKAPWSAYKEVKWSDEHVDFDSNKQFLKAELSL